MPQPARLIDELRTAFGVRLEAFEPRRTDGSNASKFVATLSRLAALPAAVSKVLKRFVGADQVSIKVNDAEINITGYTAEELRTVFELVAAQAAALREGGAPSPPAQPAVSNEAQELRALPRSDDLPNRDTSA